MSTRSPINRAWLNSSNNRLFTKADRACATSARYAGFHKVALTPVGVASRCRVAGGDRARRYRWGDGVAGGPRDPVRDPGQDIGQPAWRAPPATLRRRLLRLDGARVDQQPGSAIEVPPGERPVLVAKSGGSADPNTSISFSSNSLMPSPRM